MTSRGGAQPSEQSRCTGQRTWRRERDPRRRPVHSIGQAARPHVDAHQSGTKTTV